MNENVFALPDLGEGLTEAVLLRWLVDVGDTITVDTPVAEVETAKAAVEVPSPFAGVLTRLHGEEGGKLIVGRPLISVDTGQATDADSYTTQERAGSGNVLIGYGTTGDGAAKGSRRRRRLARSAASSSAPSPAAMTATPSASDDERLPVQSPIVRQLASRNGVDLTALTATGPNGLVTRRDVEAAIGAESATPALSEQPAVEAAHTGGGVDRRTGLPIRTRVPLTGMRKAVADTLGRSRAEIPEATTWVDVDATALLRLRAQLAEQGEAPGVLAIVARFVVAGLRMYPELNSRVDTEAGEITHLDGVNLGIATQTDRGLMVPAVRDAHRLGMRGLDTEIRRLVTATRESAATATELNSGSFTLNNYGVLGVDGSAAIINHPEVAILGMGRIIARPWVVDDAVVPRQLTQLSLVFDHRVCDGGTAGGFLRFVADAVESPTSAMTDL